MGRDVVRLPLHSTTGPQHYKAGPSLSPYTFAPCFGPKLTLDTLSHRACQSRQQKAATAAPASGVSHNKGTRLENGAGHEAQVSYLLLLIFAHIKNMCCTKIAYAFFHRKGELWMLNSSHQGRRLWLSQEQFSLGCSDSPTYRAQLYPR